MRLIFDIKLNIIILEHMSKYSYVIAFVDYPQLYGGTKMNTVIRRELILEGLDCAHCAAKIEAKVNEIDGVSSATMNFISKRLTVEVSHKSTLETILNEVTKIVKRIEPDVRVVDADKKKKDTGDEEDITGGLDKKAITIFALGTILFVIALLCNFSFYIKLALYIISYLLLGGKILLKAARNILNGRVFDENFLMSIATIGAFSTGQYPEGVGVMAFYEVGELFQSLAVNRSRKSIVDLMDIRPDFANMKAGDNIIRVSPDEVKVNDIIIVKPGEKVPLDGEVVEGRSMVNTSALTGESLPREVEEGSEVLAGFINVNGMLMIRVTREFKESTVSRILELMQNASSRKAPTENFITKFARYYTPAVVFTALALAVIPPLFMSASFSDWVYRALVFLVVSCPCALVVSIPLGFFGGIGGASRNGILVKGSNYLEALNNVDIVVFDKTGTLTKGVFNVTAIKPENGVTSETLVKYAAYAESFSNHPISASVLKAFDGEVDKDSISHYEEIPGFGIKAEVEGKKVLAGNARLMEKEGIEYGTPREEGTIVHVAIDGVYAGHIVISDEIKEDSGRAVAGLKAIGVKRTVMLTGDNRASGLKTAEELGLDEVYAELLPNQKVERLEAIDNEKQPGRKLIFVGDGINDAPVLARADIGIAMGGLGSDAAIEAADIVIMTDEPSKIVKAVEIAGRTRKIVWQNIVFALIVKAVVLMMGAGGITTMWEAVFADVGVALIAVLNAMRAMK